MAKGLYSNNYLARYVGQTTTIFTTSGGHSGRGFTGVIPSVNCTVVKLVGGSRRNISRFQGFGLGSIVEIPIGRTVAFVHNVVGSVW